ncbi:sigma-70 family RNA polymerase sigma factor [Xylocopilactobacillus apis]|uniref:sigma-70 family RNA polymerase sigma factor n=1 Tax=Xylocopilactobacillus apis TaxID=2932183 RepID=UPI002952F78C|nr:sigma-70 family RNA polymerase sigma factor [Xylocopilactobacillus apis]
MEDKGWEIYMLNKDLVIKAVIKAGVPFTHIDFNDYVEDGIILFIEFQQKWQRELNSDEGVEEFLRVVFTHIKWRTIDTIRHNNLGGFKGDIDDFELIDDEDNLTEFELRELLADKCTPRELDVVNASLNGYNHREIAKNLNLSEGRVSQIFRHVRNVLIHNLA